MIESDTIKLLRECDAGVKMGVSSIDEVLDQVKNREFKERLTACRDEHQTLDRELQALLERYHDQGKDPSPVVKGMGWLKTNMKLGWDGSDETIASLMTDGCNMGVKSLHRYLNQYRAADEASKGVARRLIGLEERLTAGIRQYLWAPVPPAKAPSGRRAGPFCGAERKTEGLIPLTPLWYNQTSIFGTNLQTL